MLSKYIVNLFVAGGLSVLFGWIFSFRFDYEVNPFESLIMFYILVIYLQQMDIHKQVHNRG